MTASITAFGFVDSTGVGDHRETIAGPPGEGFDLKSGEIFRRPYERFGRLDALSKYALAAVEMLGLDDYPCCRSQWSLVLSTRYSSARVDAEFLSTLTAPGGASPMLFSYTLPSTLLGETAMRHQITGPNLCVSAGAKSPDAALWEAVEAVMGLTDTCVAIAADVPGLIAPDAAAFAYAFLVERAPAKRPAIAEASFVEKLSATRTSRGFKALAEALQCGAGSRVAIDFPYSQDCQKVLLVETH